VRENPGRIGNQGICKININHQIQDTSKSQNCTLPAHESTPFKEKNAEKDSVAETPRNHKRDESTTGCPAAGKWNGENGIKASEKKWAKLEERNTKGV